jgi:hypothetical protein
VNPQRPYVVYRNGHHDATLSNPGYQSVPEVTEAPALPVFVVVFLGILSRRVFGFALQLLATSGFPSGIFSLSSFVVARCARPPIPA